MDMAVQEAVEGVLGKRSRIGLEVNLHEERVPGKGCKKCDEEDAGDGEGAGLVGVGRAWMFLLVLKLYQMDVAHAILFARKLDISRVTAHYLSAKFEKIRLFSSFPKLYALHLRPIHCRRQCHHFWRRCTQCNLAQSFIFNLSCLH